MNAKERLAAFLAGRPVDRRPNLTIVGSVVTQYTGITVEEYCKNGLAMAKAAVACARDAKLDYVQIASDLVREAEAYGSRINYFADKLPTVAGNTRGVEAFLMDCFDSPEDCARLLDAAAGTACNLVEALAAVAAGRSPKALFMPGCELPTATPLENLRAIHEALAEIGG